MFGRAQVGRIQGVAQFATVLASALGSFVVFDEVTFGLVNTVNVLPLWADPMVVGLLALSLAARALLTPPAPGAAK